MLSNDAAIKVGHDVSIKVTAGDISRTDADALVTAINSGGMWFGGIDGVIQRQAGNYYHAQAAQGDLTDGSAILAAGPKGENPSGTFRNVVFVVDDLQRPLHEIVRAGLEKASEAGFASVSLPTIRMGVMLGAVEKSADQAAAEMAIGVKQFLDGNPDSSLKDISFVVFRDPGTQKLLESALRLALK